MHQPLKIAFAGEMRAGKDTAVAYFLETQGGLHLKLADPLYEMQAAIQSIAGFPQEKDRALLQYLGTEYGRNKDENVWVNHLIRRVAEHRGQNIFVSDARFNNEFDALKAAGFILIKMERREDLRIEAGATHTGHLSEQDVKTYRGFDDVLTNNSSTNDLHLKLVVVVAHLRNSIQ